MQYVTKPLCCCFRLGCFVSFIAGLFEIQLSGLCCVLNVM